MGFLTIYELDGALQAKRMNEGGVLIINLVNHVNCGRNHRLEYVNTEVACEYSP